MIPCRVLGRICYSSDLPQGGLKIPCILLPDDVDNVFSELIFHSKKFNLLVFAASWTDKCILTQKISTFMVGPFRGLSDICYKEVVVYAERN